jgi:ketosteroid isomerase-like protein
MEVTPMLKRPVSFLTAFAVAFLATASAADDNRAADRDAIRADIDGIYRAFIAKDRAKVRATHDENWRGFLEGSRDMIRGIDDYMNYVGPMTSPYGMSAYKIRDFDIVFHGDAAFVTFVTDVELKLPEGARHSVQRLADFYVKTNGKWTQAGSNTSISPEAVAAQMQEPQTLSDQSRQSLLAAREAVWRAFFTNDRAALDKLLPDDLITIEASGAEFGRRASVVAAAASFAQSGAKLVRLEFPKTDIQVYGATAIIYSTYVYELEKDSQRALNSGRVTEIFVNRKGQWVNPGWHMDTGR